MKPEIIYIETTNLCNANCIMCPHSKIERNPSIMRDEIFYKVIEHLKEAAVKGKQIFLHKEGEPLLDPQIMERIAYADRMLGQYNEIGINTNAMLLDGKKAKQLLESGIGTVYFSVDGVSKKEYEAIRINLNFETVVENIKHFFKLHQQKKSKVRVIMQMLIQNDDSNSAEAFKNMWKKYPCEFYIKKMHGYLDGGHSSQTLKRSHSQVNTCTDPNRIEVVFTDGNVGLCCWDYNNEYNIGNVMEDSLITLFNNERANHLRRSLDRYEGEKIVPCNRCARIFGSDEISKY